MCIKTSTDKIYSALFPCFSLLIAMRGKKGGGGNHANPAIGRANDKKKRRVGGKSKHGVSEDANNHIVLQTKQLSIRF